MKNKKIKLIVVLLVLIFVSSIILFITIKESKKTGNQIEIVDTVEVVYNQELKNLWASNELINSDYVGQIIFDSEIINLPFVCPSGDVREYSFYDNNGNLVTDYDNGCEAGACSGNDVYLRTNWQTMEYDVEGTAFMDYRNSIDDQNIIIYGHHYAPSFDEARVKMFTPLELFLEQENYEKNKYLELVFENEIRKYEVVYVYIYHLDFNDYDDYDTLQYYRTNYEFDYFNNDDAGYYQEYIDKIEEVKLYDTGEKLTPNDKTLTLQTCITHTPSEKQIVVCKEIERIVN